MLTDTCQRTHEQLAYELGRSERDGREAMIRDGGYVRVLIVGGELNVELWKCAGLSVRQRTALLELFGKSSCTSAVVEERATGRHVHLVGRGRLAGALPRTDPGRRRT